MCPFVLVVALLPLSHALDEPTTIAKAVKAAARADVDAALKAAAATERCKDALSADPGLLGLECRAVVAAAIVHGKPLVSTADAQVRVALFYDLVVDAGNVSAFDPLTAQPGLGRARFDAHRAVARSLMTLFDDLDGSKPGTDARKAADAFLKSDTAPKAKACTAVGRSVELATGADASLEERGAMQAMVTSHSCFLDESRLRVEPKPGKALSDSKDAASVAASTSASGAILEYAASRTLDLQRCVDKHVKADGTADDNKKLESCACGAVARWKFPGPKVDVDVALPLGATLAVRVTVAANGAVHSCGPVVPPGSKGAP